MLHVSMHLAHSGHARIWSLSSLAKVVCDGLEVILSTLRKYVHLNSRVAGLQYVIIRLLRQKGTYGIMGHYQAYGGVLRAMCVLCVRCVCAVHKVCTGPYIWAGWPRSCFPKSHAGAAL